MTRIASKRIVSRAVWCMQIGLLMGLFGLPPVVEGQSARTRTATSVHKEPRGNSPVVAEVAGGTELPVFWDKPVWVDLLKHGPKPPAGSPIKVSVLLPSRVTDGQVWVRVGPNNKKGWIRREAAEFVPGSELSFSKPAAVRITVQEQEIPRLVEMAPLSQVHSRLTSARQLFGAPAVRLLLVVAPDGRTTTVEVVRSSRGTLAEQVFQAAARQFRFEPVAVGGTPVFTLLILEFEIRPEGPVGPEGVERRPR